MPANANSIANAQCERTLKSDQMVTSPLNFNSHVDIDVTCEQTFRAAVFSLFLGSNPPTASTEEPLGSEEGRLSIPVLHSTTRPPFPMFELISELHVHLA